MYTNKLCIAGRIEKLINKRVYPIAYKSFWTSMTPPTYNMKGIMIVTSKPSRYPKIFIRSPDERRMKKMISGKITQIMVSVFICAIVFVVEETQST